MRLKLPILEYAILRLLRAMRWRCIDPSAGQLDHFRQTSTQDLKGLPGSHGLSDSPGGSEVLASARVLYKVLTRFVNKRNK